jgi:hypothetical protein
LIDMGKRKTTSEQTNKPVYGAEIEGAARSQQDAYNQSQPMINQAANDMTGASSDLFAQFRQGDPTIQAAQGALQGMLAGGENPYLEQMLDRTNNRVMNQMQAQNAVRGRTGGSDANGIIARALASNETGARFEDFNNQQNRRLQAAQLAPGLLAGSMLPAEMGAQLGTQGAMLPLQGALANSAGVGGLLGQYQNVKGEQTQSGGLLGSILSGLAQGGIGALTGGMGGGLGGLLGLGKKAAGGAVGTVGKGLSARVGMNA